MPPDFREKQLAKFRELAPEMDIVITTALIPGRGAPNLWLAGMVAAMKSGSVAVDLAAERGGNCDLTVTGPKIVSDNGVAVIRLGPEKAHGRLGIAGRGQIKIDHVGETVDGPVQIRPLSADSYIDPIDAGEFQRIRHVWRQ